MTPSKAHTPKHALDRAYLEAGHAVAAWRLGIMLKRLSLNNKKRRNVWDDPLRNVDFNWVRRNRSAMVERLAAVLVAGVVAQTAFADSEPMDESQERLDDAMTLLDSHVASLYGSSVESLQHDWREFLEHDDARRALDILASRLLERGKVGGKAATRILDEHLSK